LRFNMHLPLFDTQHWARLTDTAILAVGLDVGWVRCLLPASADDVAAATTRLPPLAFWFHFAAPDTSACHAVRAPPVWFSCGVPCALPFTLASSAYSPDHSRLTFAGCFRFHHGYRLLKARMPPDLAFPLNVLYLVIQARLHTLPLSLLSFHFFAFINDF